MITLDILQLDDIFKILLAVVIGGLIGIEREFRDKAAGFRTLIFICLGATLFTNYSLKITIGNNPIAVGAGIVTGIGFLGSGVIMRENGRVYGMTTAAAIWLTAALGMGIGLGLYQLTGLVTLVILVVLWLFPYFEIWIDRVREERTYEITCTQGIDKADELEALVKECGLRMQHRRRVKWEKGVISTLALVGRHTAHDAFKQTLFEDKAVKEFRYY